MVEVGHALSVTTVPATQQEMSATDKSRSLEADSPPFLSCFPVLIRVIILKNALITV